MSRSKWKLNILNNNLNKNILLFKRNKKNKIFTWSRDIIIDNYFVGCIINLYNGLHYTKFMITDLMINHRLGEFSRTRKPFKFKPKEKQKKK